MTRPIQRIQLDLCIQIASDLHIECYSLDSIEKIPDDIVLPGAPGTTGRHWYRR